MSIISKGLSVSSAVERLAAPGTVRRALTFTALVLPTFACAGFRVDALSGTIMLDGSPGGIGSTGNSGSLYSSDALGAGSATLFSENPYDPGNPYGSRGIARFQANQTVGGGNTSFNLPSDRSGNVSSAANGEVRKFATWDGNMAASFGLPIHTFGMAVNAQSGDEAEVDFSFANVEYSLQYQVAGGNPLSYLDNSIYDLNSAPGAITIQQSANPINTMTGTASFNVQRGQVFDGDNMIDSPFYDGLFMGSYTTIMQNGMQVGNGIFSSFSPILNTWAPGDSTTNFLAPGQTVDQYYDFSGLAPGTYEMDVQDIVWDSMGTDMGLITDYYPGEGHFAGNTVAYSLTVLATPEPCGFAAIGFGLLALGVRRRTRR